MALTISGGTTGATGSYTATGVTQVIAGGAFNGNGVSVTVVHGGKPAPVYNFAGAGAISLQTVSGATVAVKVEGGNTSNIDVTCNP